MIDFFRSEHQRHRRRKCAPKSKADVSSSWEFQKYVKFSGSKKRGHKSKFCIFFFMMYCRLLHHIPSMLAIKDWWSISFRKDARINPLFAALLFVSSFRNFIFLFRCSAASRLWEMIFLLLLCTSYFFMCITVHIALESLILSWYHWQFGGNDPNRQMMICSKKVIILSGRLAYVLRWNWRFLNFRAFLFLFWFAKVGPFNSCLLPKLGPILTYFFNTWSFIEEGDRKASVLLLCSQNPPGISFLFF